MAWIQTTAPSATDYTIINSDACISIDWVVRGDGKHECTALIYGTTIRGAGLSPYSVRVALCDNDLDKSTVVSALETILSPEVI